MEKSSFLKFYTNNYKHKTKGKEEYFILFIIITFRNGETAIWFSVELKKLKKGKKWKKGKKEKKKEKERREHFSVIFCIYHNPQPVEVVKLLLDRGADVNHVQDTGITALVSSPSLYLYLSISLSLSLSLSLSPFFLFFIGV